MARFVDYNRDAEHDIINETPDYISQFSDGSNVYTIKDATARSELTNKQDTLVSGTNIKTINNQSILGEGNINISSGDSLANQNNYPNAITPLKLWQGTEYQWINGQSLTWYYWQTNISAMWSYGSDVPEDVLGTMCYGNGVFVRISSTNLHTIYSTDNGQSWNYGGDLPNTISSPIMCYGNGKFIIKSTDSVNGAYSTDNGQSWVALSFPTAGASFIKYIDDRFILTNITKYGTTGIYHSFDGINWTKSISINFSGYSSFGYSSYLTYDNNCMFFVCSQAFMYYNTKIFISKDKGETWEEYDYTSLIGSESLQSLPIVCCGNGITIFKTAQSFLYSDDYGETWETITASIAASNMLYGNGKFVAHSGNSYSSSTNGLTWSSYTLPSSYNRILYEDGKFLFYNSSGQYNKTALSLDGINVAEYTMSDSKVWGEPIYGNGIFIAKNSSDVKIDVYSISYNECYTLDQNPTTSSQVYLVPEITSTKTITSVGSGAITLSDNLVYNSTPSGNQNTYRTIGDAHPDWLSNIDNVGVKIGNTIVATAGGSGSNYTAGTGIDIISNEISVTSDISTGAALGTTAVQPSALASVATSGSYSDLSDKPTIPTVNNATLTIQKNGSNVATFTANASSNVTANISVPTNTNELTNGAGFITSDALSGYQTTANLVTSVSNSSTDTQYPSAKCVYDNILDYYGTCSTAAGTQAKVVVCSGFALKTGASVRVKFTNSQTYNGQPTLNVNGTGPINVVYKGTTAAGRYWWQAGEVVSFTYDGTNWIIEDAALATTSYYGQTVLQTSVTSTKTDRSLTPASVNNLVLNMIEPYAIYSTTSSYAVGDKVRYSYNAWICNTAIAEGGEAWNTEHWTMIDPIQTQIDDIYSQIGDLESAINIIRGV